MSNIAVVYWSGTGNTEAMAFAVAEGARGKGADVSLLTASEFSEDQIGRYDAIAFGCPSMGAEQLEESEFEPMFTACEGGLSGKKIALFGSYGWGDGGMDAQLGITLPRRRGCPCPRQRDLQRSPGRGRSDIVPGTWPPRSSSRITTAMRVSQNHQVR